MEDQAEDTAQYEKQVAEGVHDPFPYDRLMIIYRKEKKYKDELRVIKKGITVFTKQLQETSNRSFKEKKNRKKLQDLSILIGKKVGLVDKKGNSNYLPEPIARWEKRKATVEKKMGK